MASESEDRYVRDAVYRKLDPKVGRTKLAIAYSVESIKARLISILVDMLSLRKPLEQAYDYCCQYPAILPLYICL